MVFDGLLLTLIVIGKVEVVGVPIVAAVAALPKVYFPTLADEVAAFTPPPF